MLVKLCRDIVFIGPFSLPTDHHGLAEPQIQTPGSEASGAEIHGVDRSLVISLLLLDVPTST